jgi:hypothetical protein
MTIVVEAMVVVVQVPMTVFLFIIFYYSYDSVSIYYLLL